MTIRASGPRRRPTEAVRLAREQARPWVGHDGEPSVHVAP